jgi:peptidoglycan/LPS O-acetylase OafA/YrhL
MGNSVLDWLRTRYAALFPFGRQVSVGQGLSRRADNFLLLRIAAASLVIYGHAAAIAPAVEGPDWFVRAGFGMYSGEIAVNVFFLISGFLVTGSYLRQDSLVRFLKLRALRLIPGFLLNLFLLAYLFGPLLTQLSVSDYLSHPQTWQYVWKNIWLSSDMAWQLPGVFEGAKTSTINGSQWTLPAEVRMYLLLGILGAIGMFASKRVAVCGLATLLVAGLFWPYLFPLHSDWFRLGGYFLLGVAIFVMRDRVRIRLEFVIALVLLALLTRHLPVYPQVFALALAATAFFIAYMTRPIHWLERFGDPSYGIYLWGWPSQQVVAHLMPAAGLATHVVLSLLMAFALGYASWHLIEKQALRLK